MSTILEIDDDAGLRSVLMRFLAIEGFVPIGATNGQEALDYLRGADRPTRSCWTSGCP